MNNITLYSAGVLPYSISYDNTIYFLLGKDYENKWSDFGGRCEAADNSDVALTAAREYWEESVGCISDIHYIKKCLRKCKYVESKTTLGYPYYMFLLKIPFKEEYKYYFRSTRNFIEKINVDRKYKEKLDIRWFSINNILDHKGFMILKNNFNNTFINKYEEILQIIYDHNNKLIT